MRKRRRGYNYKFTEKTHSLKGILGLLLAILSILAGGVLIGISYTNAGNGTVYLGSVGVLAMISAAAAFILAVISMREENRYRVFPVGATILGAVALAGWVSIYALGFLGM